MAKLLMVTGDRALAQGKKGAFYNTLEELHKHFERIDIITPQIEDYKSQITNIFDNVFIHSSPWPLIFQPFWIFREGLRILRSSNLAPSKLVPSNWVMTVHDYPPFYNGIGARLLWQKIKVPYILEIFHIPGYPKPADKKEFIYRSLAKVFFGTDASRARAVRIMNSSVGDFLKLSGVPGDKLVLIPAIYVDLDVFKPMNLKKEYDLIFIGRLESNKGIDLFLDAVRLMVNNSSLPVKCLIVGEGSLRKELEQRTINYELNNYVFFYGWAKDQNEVTELINKSKILVMPSYNEGGPRVVVEAMACGVPVLATPVGIVPDLLKNGHGGAIIEWDAEDIVGKANKILGEFGLYSSMSNTATEMAKSFEKKTAIKNYADKLKELIR